MYKEYADIWADVPGFKHQEEKPWGVFRWGN